MHSIKKIISILNIRPEELSIVFTQCFGKSKNEHDLIVKEWIRQKILEDYEKYRYNKTIVEYIANSEDILTPEVNLIYTLKTFPYHRSLISDFILIVQQLSIDLQLDIKLIWALVAQFDIPYPFRRLAVIFLMSYLDKNNSENTILNSIIIETLESICLSEANVIDKFYAISLLKYYFSHTNIKISEDPLMVCLNDIERLESISENGLRIEGNKHFISDANLVQLENITKKILKTTNSAFRIKRKTSNSEIFNVTRFIVSNFRSEKQQSEYIVKIIEKIGNSGDVFEFRSISYSEADYLCLICMLVDLPDIIEYYSDEISKRLIVPIGIYLIQKNIDQAEFRILEIISSNLPLDLKIDLLLILSEIDDKTYINRAIGIIKNSHMINSTIDQKTRILEICSSLQ